MAKKINLGKVGITTEGNYDSSKAYEKLCCVLHNGVSWVSTTDVPAGNAPDEGSAYWQKISERGESYIDKELVPIVDNLTEGGSEKVLSAEQGKVLGGKLTELELKITLIEQMLNKLDL